MSDDETTITKPAVKSTTIWGGLLTQVGAAIIAVPILVQQVIQALAPVQPFLPPQVNVTLAIIGAAAASLGGIVAIRGRLKTDNKPIKGVITQQE